MSTYLIWNVSEDRKPTSPTILFGHKDGSRQMQAFELERAIFAIK